MDEEKLCVYLNILYNNLKNEHITILLDIPSISKYYNKEDKYKFYSNTHSNFENFLLEAFIKDYFVDNFFGDNDFLSIYNNSPIGDKISMIQNELDNAMLSIDKIKNETNIMLQNIILNEKMCLLKLISFLGGIKS